jgi:hypothetical protein
MKQFQMLAIEAKKHRDDFRQKDDHRAFVAAKDKSWPELCHKQSGKGRFTFIGNRNAND